MLLRSNIYLLSMLFRHSSTMFLPLYLIVRPVSTEGSRGSSESHFCEMPFYTNVKPLFQNRDHRLFNHLSQKCEPTPFFQKCDPLSINVLPSE